MHPDTTTEEPARQSWNRITGRARKAEQHAAILDARSKYGRSTPPDWAMMVEHYHRLTTGGVYSFLDALQLTASQAADLDRVVTAGTAGLPSWHVPARDVLVRYQLVAQTRDHATVRATHLGIALARAMPGRPLILSASDAASLADLEADGGRVGWPGTATALRMCHHWKLIELVGDRYVITPQGRKALAEHRNQSTTAHIVPSDGQGEILAYLARRPNGHIDLAELPSAPVKQCVGRMWIVRSGIVAGTRRSGFRITEAGRDALARWTVAKERAKEKLPRMTAGQLKPGMWVRLLNRPVIPVGPEFVRVDHLTKVQGPTVRTPKWEIWVSSGTGDPYLYCDRAFFQATRFECRSAES